MFLHGTTEANLCRLSLILAKRVSRHNHLRFLSLAIMSTGQNRKVETTPSGSNASARLLSDSILIVRICQELGKGPGGFYQPGYNDGAKLRLRMMCLGLDWDPQTRKYGKKRQVDGCEPSVIPCEFKQLVQRSMSEAHALIKMDSKVSNVEDILPALSPDICIVNFYNTSGRLGLHQDRDESRYSLKKGLPVVSFSVGDSAEFLYGDERDANKAEKVLLESGDVLIFGGESRHVFHGVSSINPNSAPGALLENTMLRPGRLNLTFRQY